jgi:hypothetical protein
MRRWLGCLLFVPTLAFAAAIASMPNEGGGKIAEERPLMRGAASEHTAFATMADPAPNTAAAGSAPTAPTAALVQSSCRVVMFHAAIVRMGLSHLHMGPRISGPLSNTTGLHGITLAMLVQESPVEDGCTSTKPILVLGFMTPLSIDTCGSTAR